MAVVRRAQRDRAAVEQNIKTRNLLHPVSNHTFSTAYFAICRVGLRFGSVRAKRVPLAHSTVSQRCHRIASFSSALQADKIFGTGSSLSIWMEH